MLLACLQGHYRLDPAACCITPQQQEQQQEEQKQQPHPTPEAANVPKKSGWQAALDKTSNLQCCQDLERTPEKTKLECANSSLVQDALPAAGKQRSTSAVPNKLNSLQASPAAASSKPNGIRHQKFPADSPGTASSSKARSARNNLQEGIQAVLAAATPATAPSYLGGVMDELDPLVIAHMRRRGKRGYSIKGKSADGCQIVSPGPGAYQVGGESTMRYNGAARIIGKPVAKVCI